MHDALEHRKIMLLTLTYGRNFTLDELNQEPKHLPLNDMAALALSANYRLATSMLINFDLEIFLFP